MPYPENPFDNSFDINDILKVQFVENNVDNLSNEHEDTEYKLRKLLLWLCTPPTISSIRCNESVLPRDELITILERKFSENKYIETLPKVYGHPSIPDVIIIEHLRNFNHVLDNDLNEVIVDSICGAAILRGAHIYAQGVLALQSGSQIGDRVNVYADLGGTCKKGYLKKFESAKKLFIGTGVLHQSRKELFQAEIKPRGLAVEIVSTISCCPPINDKELWEFGAILQNLPSIVCGHVLNPQPGDVVLDMCAAPGNKTTHLATLMNNQGTLIALEKVTSKIQPLITRCKAFSATTVQVHQFNAINAVAEDINPESKFKPPFQKQTFDKILLDVPCSGLGQRPQLRNKITNKELRSYASLQRKIFRSGVDLLKHEGHLVYSTCTVTIAENEEMVAWALKTFPCLKLIPAVPKIGGPGWKIPSLTIEQCNYLQRFSFEHENKDCDSVGFFIAHFEKV